MWTLTEQSLKWLQVHRTSAFSKGNWVSNLGSGRAETDCTSASACLMVDQWILVGQEGLKHAHKQKSGVWISWNRPEQAELKCNTARLLKTIVRNRTRGNGRVGGKTKNSRRISVGNKMFPSSIVFWKMKKQRIYHATKNVELHLGYTNFFSAEQLAPTNEKRECRKFWRHTITVQMSVSLNPFFGIFCLFHRLNTCCCCCCCRVRRHNWNKRARVADQAPNRVSSLRSSVCPAWGREV